MAKYLDNDGVLYLWNKVKALFNKGITGLKVSGRTITYTKGDGTTGTIITQDTTYGVVSKTANGLMSSNDKTKLDGIASGAEVNQNAFSTITVGTESIVADSKTDTLKIVFGEYMSVEATPSEDKLTFNVVVDGSLSPSSTKPISNKTVYNALLNKVDIDDIEDMQSQINSAQQTANDVYNALPNYALKSDITNTYKYKGSVTNSSNLPTSGQAVGDTYNIVNASTYGPAGTNVAWDGSKWDALGGLFEIESITNAELDTICV